MSELQSIIDKYNMKQHPEGGYYVETYRSEQLVYLNNSKHEGGRQLYQSITNTISIDYLEQ